MNNDGKLDIVFLIQMQELQYTNPADQYSSVQNSYRSVADVYIFLNTGTPTAPAFTGSAIVGPRLGPSAYRKTDHLVYSVAFADFNKDGKTVTVLSLIRDLSWFLSNLFND